MEDSKYSDLVEIIKDRKKEPPKDMHFFQQIGWVSGYSQCEKDILAIIKGLEGDMENDI
jgi:hypothetical protein